MSKRSSTNACVLITSSPAASCIGRWQEWSIETTGWSEGIYGPMLRVVDGTVEVPTSPGWGVELDPLFVRTAELTTSRA